MVVDSPKLADVERLPAAEAGDLALGARQHRPIATVARVDRGMAPPGRTELLMTERPVADASGCVRRRWTVAFVHGGGKDEADATLSSAFDTMQIALPRAGVCPTRNYVHVNPGLAPAEAFAALRLLRRLQSGGLNARFTCRDHTPSGLCARRRRISDSNWQGGPHGQ